MDYWLPHTKIPYSNCENFIWWNHKLFIFIVFDRIWDVKTGVCVRKLREDKSIFISIR